jgi:hypothetical protein
MILEENQVKTHHSIKYNAKLAAAANATTRSPGTTRQM